MNPLESPQTHLLLAIALNASLLISAKALANRASGEFLSRLGDTLLLWFVGQYLSVMIPGALGMLSLSSILGCTVIVSLAMLLMAYWTGPRLRAYDVSRWNIVGMVAVFGFLAGYIGAILWLYCVTLPTANDALTYHLPAAAQWLREGRISLLPTWNFNPANTYSPLAGSALIAWWSAPLGCDFLARFVGFFPLLLIAVGLARIAIGGRVNVVVALLLGLGGVLCWPIITQADKVKDDLYVVALLLWSVAGLTIVGRFRGARVGLALGLLIAMKYTALLALPMLLPALCRRVQWKNVAIVLALILVLAGPWYVRNAVLTGNPLYPLDFLGLKSLFSTTRATEFRSLSRLWDLLTGPTRNYAAPSWLVIGLIACNIGAIVTHCRKLRQSRMIRVALFGPWIGLLAVVATAPFPEIRFLLPCLALLLASAALLPPRIATACIGVLTIATLATTFSVQPELQHQFLIGGTVVSTIAAAYAWGFTSLIGVWRRRARQATVIFGVALLVLSGSVLYQGLLSDYLSDEAAILSWENAYSRPTADAWVAARHVVPVGETIAYAGSWYPYPLMGPDHRTPVVFVSPVPKIDTITDLPRLGDHLTGDALVSAARRAVRDNADPATWWQRLMSRNVRFVFISKDLGPTPETDFVRNPTHFQILFENASAIIARVR